MPTKTVICGREIVTNSSTSKKISNCTCFSDEMTYTISDGVLDVKDMR